MTLSRLASCCAVGPKQRQHHYSYDENVDEPAKLIEDEATEIEQENESIEGQQDKEKHEPPAFEE
jgi:hypothetical protein